tara:strand:+ start:72 stop:299 length:228 start_codon:yes stop_codon:yes gene_type:complete
MLDPEAAAATNIKIISGRIRPPSEEEAVSSKMMTGSMTGASTLPAKEVDAATPKAAASANFFILFLQLIAHSKIK